MEENNSVKFSCGPDEVKNDEKWGRFSSFRALKRVCSEEYWRYRAEILGVDGKSDGGFNGYQITSLKT